MKRNLFLVLFIIISIKTHLAQISCTGLIHFKSKGYDEVNNIRVLNNGHYLLAGMSIDTLYLNNNLTASVSGSFAIIAELDENKNLIFQKTFSLINFQNGDFVKGIDVLKDNNNYYALINWNGNLSLDSTNTINGSNGMILIKINNSGNVLWYYYLNNAIASSMCFDNNNNIYLFARTTTNLGYTPSSILFLNINKNNGTLRKNKIGTNAFNNIISKKIYFDGANLWSSCSFNDSIVFNQQKIIGSINSSAIIKMDSSFNIQKYSIFTTKNSSNLQINDFTIDNQLNIYAIGYYIGNSLYINDTIRLNKTSSIIQQMYIAKLDKNLNFQWAKQENLNPTNIVSNNVRYGYKICTDNNNLYTLGYFLNSIIIGSDTLNGTSLILSQYNNNGMALRAQKINGIYNNGIYTLNYDFYHQKVAISIPFNTNTSVCQTTLTPLGDIDVYIMQADKLTNVPLFLNDKSNTINIYPNPCNDKLFLSHQNTSSYEIYNIYGTLVDKGTYYSFIPVQHLPDGIYLLKIINQEHISYGKFIVHH